MSVVDPTPDCGRPADLPLGLGLDPAFRPRPGVARGDHVLYVGRLAREKGCAALLDAAARSSEAYELRFVGTGPLEDHLRARAARLGIARRVSFHPFEASRDAWPAGTPPPAPS
jgi:alpha-1,6-mannosyltransferase